MGVPLIQQYRVASYITRQKLRGQKRYPLVLMLEPLFRCNLACAGCGKIEHPEEILDKTLSVEECLAAVDECGAPVVSIAGGESTYAPMVCSSKNIWWTTRPRHTLPFQFTLTEIVSDMTPSFVGKEYSIWQWMLLKQQTRRVSGLP
jgi:hypothetical protein